VYIEIFVNYIYLFMKTAARTTNFTGGEKSLQVDLVSKFSDHLMWWKTSGLMLALPR